MLLEESRRERTMRQWEITSAVGVLGATAEEMIVVSRRVRLRDTQ